MSDLIDRGRAVELVRITADEWLADIQESSYRAGFSLGTHIAMQTIVRDVPSAEKKGHWENIDIIHDRKDAKITDWQQAQCSVCGKWNTKPYLYGIDLDPYCPSCGARMVE